MTTKTGWHIYQNDRKQYGVVSSATGYFIEGFQTVDHAADWLRWWLIELVAQARQERLERDRILAEMEVRVRIQ